MNASSEPRMHEDQVETTIFSISAAAPAQPDRRADERFVRLLRVGAIVIGERRELCLIRNISAGGMMIRAYSSIPVGTGVSIELKQGQAISGTVHWSYDPLTGIRFDARIDVVSLLASDAAGPLPRLPRIEVECGAWIRQQARLLRVTALNISQGGLCVRSDAALEPGGDVVVTLPGITPAPGVVRWSKAAVYGIAFNSALALPDLVEWLKGRQGQTGERIAS